MTLTEHARRYLMAEGIPAETVIKVGSSMKEVIAANQAKIDGSDVLEKLGLKLRKYLVLSAHREENLDNPKNFEKLVDAINAVAEKYQLPIIFSTHPRTQKMIDEQGVKLHSLVQSMKPLGFADYIKLQQNAFCVVSDSGTITEESSILGFPAVTIREAHERPEGMDEGTLIMSGVDKDDIISAIEVVTGQSVRLRIVNDYDVDNVSQKVVRIILSYVGYINRTIWRKSGRDDG